ncbi:MAG: YHS domain-containing (seleno)protein [Ferruginibacter sp.]
MKKIVWSVCLLLMAGITATAQKSATFIESGRAIRGYDPVAYFMQEKAVPGVDSLVYQWNNADWYFSSREHLDQFKANPAKYAPQYGGYCAYGLSNGYKAPTNADAWTITDGKLYLNYNLEVRDEWNKQRAERIKKADQNWPAVKNKK